MSTENTGIANTAQATAEAFPCLVTSLITGTCLISLCSAYVFYKLKQKRNPFFMGLLIGCAANFVYYILKLAEIYSPQSSFIRSFFRILALLSVYGGLAWYSSLALSRLQKFEKDYSWVTDRFVQILNIVLLIVAFLKPLAEVVKEATRENNGFIVMSVVVSFGLLSLVKYVCNILIVRAVFKNAVSSENQVSPMYLALWIGFSMTFSLMSAAVIMFGNEEKGQDALSFILCMVADIELSLTYIAECVFQILLSGFIKKRNANLRVPRVPGEEPKKRTYSSLYDGFMRTLLREKTKLRSESHSSSSAMKESV